MQSLPKPDYQRQDTDPDWLAYAVQFHGHLGPWATAGLRAGMCARRAVDAKGYFDLDVTVEGPFVKPPHSCLLDGLQVSTGATWGKRNLVWVKGERIVVRVKNTRTGKLAEVRPTPELLKLLTSFMSGPKTDTGVATQDHDDDEADHELLEQLARRIARLPEEQLLSVTYPADKEAPAAGRP